MGGSGAKFGESREAKNEQIVFSKISQTANVIREQQYETAMIFDPNTGEETRKRITQFSGNNVIVPMDGTTYMKTLVHNHPSGGCFSGEDLYMSKMLAGTIWAVTKTHNFIFRWNSPSNITEKWASEFKDKVNKMHDDMHKKAKQEWDKKHGSVDEVIKRCYEKHEITVKEMNNILEARGPGIKELYHKKTIDWFKNNASKYGYKFSARRV